MIRFGLLGLWLLIGPSPTVRLPGDTYAVVVGISDYKALTYRNGDLRYADQDARRVAAFLASQPGGHVPPHHIRLLTNTQATNHGIRQAMRLFGQARPTDRILLYFSGHGLTDSFVPYDVDPRQGRSLLTYADIKAAFRASRAGTKLCIADACLSGNLMVPTARSSTESSRLSPEDQPLKKFFSGSQTLAHLEGSTVAMLLASRSTQAAIEDRRLAAGTFTYFLLKGLQGNADQNDDRTVTIKELHRYVVPRVRQASQGKQSPVFYGRFPDNLPLAYF